MSISNSYRDHNEDSVSNSSFESVQAIELTISEDEDEHDAENYGTSFTEITSSSLALNEKSNPSSGTTDSENTPSKETNTKFFEELCYLDLQHPTNIYGLTTVTGQTGHSWLLVATRKSVLLVHYRKGKIYKVPMHFPQSASNMEIISIASFLSTDSLPAFSGEGELKKYIVIVITFAEMSETNVPVGFEMGIHGATVKVSELNDKDVSLISGDCQRIKLNFFPLKIDNLIVNNHEGILLCGNDNNIHVYSKCKDFYQEIVSINSLLDLPPLDGSVQAVLVKDVGIYQIVCLGLSSGYLALSATNIRDKKIIIMQSVYFEGPITSLQLFLTEENQDSNFDPIVHLLVTCAVEISVVYMDILQEGLESILKLPQSDLHDSVLCSCVADFDWDRRNEIFIGTYGHKVLGYRLVTVEGPASPSINDGNYYRNPTNNTLYYWKLFYMCTMPRPIYAIDYIDVTEDGMKELVLLTLNGVHLFQHNIEAALRKLKASLDSIFV